MSWADRIGRFLGGLLVAFGWLAGVVDDDYGRGVWQILVGLMIAYVFGWRPEVRHRVDRLRLEHPGSPEGDDR